MVSNAADSAAMAKVIEQNKSLLHVVNVSAGDKDLPSIAPSITTCGQQVVLRIGSHALTNTSALVIADTLWCHHSLKAVALTGPIDGDSFASIGSSLLDSSAQPGALTLRWTMLSMSMQSSTLTSLTCLNVLQLVGNPFGDDSFQQLAIHFSDTFYLPFNIPLFCTFFFC